MNNQQKFLMARDEIRHEIVEMLKQVESDFVLQDVLDVIFHEEDTDDMTKIVAMFDTSADCVELSDILELITDAWNYFPHKALYGRSPIEMRKI